MGELATHLHTRFPPPAVVQKRSQSTAHRFLIQPPTGELKLRESRTEWRQKEGRTGGGEGEGDLSTQVSESQISSYPWSTDRMHCHLQDGWTGKGDRLPLEHLDFVEGELPPL